MVSTIQFDHLNQFIDVDESPIKAHLVGSYHKPLPQSFVPGEWDVLCCGGKEGSEHGTFTEANCLTRSSTNDCSLTHALSSSCSVGNKRYRVLIENNVQAYRNARTKHQKSLLVSTIVASVKDASVNGLGGFVKKDPLTERYYQVEDKIAREKVSHALRDAIKVQKRKEARESRLSDRLDTRVSPNKRGRDHFDALDTQLSLERILFPPPSKRSCVDPKGDLVTSGDVKECMGTWFTVIASDNDDDWERSLKESTERFLQSDEGDLSCWTL